MSVENSVEFVDNRALGKDEVPGSNPGNSSKKNPENLEFSGFFVFPQKTQGKAQDAERRLKRG